METATPVLGAEAKTPAIEIEDEELVSIKKDLYIRLIKTGVIKGQSIEDI